MSDETKTRLFEPFFTTKEVGKGTGLGLATVFGIVTQSGGTISVNSALGRGSAFTITLPMASGEVHMPEQVDPVVIEGTEAVLLVEDEETVRTLARAILERAGYRVVEAPNVPDALRISADRPFDLLVADVLMPGGTGPDLFRTLVAARPDLRVLYMSGYAKDTILDIRQLDAHAGFLAKPFTVESLTRKVREVLDR
jgi:CheY-like chemotaxis protein